MDRKGLALNAYSKVVRIKRANNIDLASPINIYDFVEENGVEIRFIETKSIEGIYSKEPGPLILIGAYRPKGRQTFTCAHEFGHHVFQHGSRVDKISQTSNKNNEEEFLVDCFAGYFLMPREAIYTFLQSQNIELKFITSREVYRLSCYLGVGYETLISHLYYALSLIPFNQFTELRKISKKKLLRSYLDMDFNDLIIIDTYWKMPVDLNVGDILLVPKNVLNENDKLELMDYSSDGIYYMAKTTGLGRLYDKTSNWAIFFRISRKNFVGRNKYKHLEDLENE